jgi:ABC-2 type transport system ATP-binding protein
VLQFPEMPWAAGGTVEEPPGQVDVALDVAPPAPPLEMRSIVKSWPGAGTVVDGIDLVLDRGTALAICGHNGTGKTTLLRIACAMIAPDSGTVRAGGVDPERARMQFHRRVGFVSAGNAGLYARLKAEQHLDLAARLALIPRAERGAAVARAVDAFELAPLCGKRVDRLSMGQRQRLRLALGFLHDPDLVLIDEPTSSLDDAGIALLVDALDALKTRGGAALVCMPTHWEQIPALDAGMVLDGGRLERT